MSITKLPFILILLLGLSAAACAESDASSPATETAPVSKASSEVQTIVIEPVGNTMTFATT